MDKPSSTALSDWAVLTLRWVFIMGVCIWLAFGETVDWMVLSIVGAATLANILATIIVVTNRTSFQFRLVSTIGDFLFAQALFFLSLGAGTGRELTWVAILSQISASLFFQWPGMAIALVLNTALIGWQVFYRVSDPRELILPFSIWAMVYLIVGGTMAFLSGRFHQGLHFPKRARLSRSGRVRTKDQDKRQTIFELISALSATLNYHKVLETSLDLSATALAELDAPTDRLVSAIMLFTGRSPKISEMKIATGRRLLPTDKNVTLTGTSGVLAGVIEEANPAYIHNPKNDPELRQLFALHECQSAFVLPLRTGLDAYGVMLFGHPVPSFFTPERRDVLELVSHQACIAIQNARLYQALEQERNRMMEIQDESRKKLARDLHDGPTQSISAIAMRINFARRLMERDQKSASEELFKIEDLARRTTKEIRHMLFTLRPLVLESQGLAAAFKSMAEKMQETYNQEVVVQVDERAVDAMEVGKQAVVFYLADEAVTNARKHAQAKHIWLRLKMLRESLCLLEVEDDGIGFDTSAVDASYESRGSLGMINLRERTELVRGVLRIDSVKGRGTRIQVVIPLTEEAADRLQRGG
jgi:signal transduction histidine kinase